MKDDFGRYEPPLVVGSVRGARGWRFNKGGLESPHARGNFWTQEEQVARCGHQKGHRLRDLRRPWTFVDHEESNGLIDCMCGFYAYYQDSLREVDTIWGVVGVIEGYGQTTLGTKGFRCEKAKILALAPSRKDGIFRYGSCLDLYWISELRNAFPDIPVYRKAQDMWHDFPATRLEDVAGSLGRTDLVK